MVFLFFAIVIGLSTFNVIFMLTKIRDRAGQRKKFAEIDRFKAQQRALGNPPESRQNDKVDEDFSQLRKDTIHIWKD